MIKFFHKSRLIGLSLLLLSGTLTGCKTPQEEKGEYFGYTKQTEENNVAGEYSDGLAYYVSRDHKEAAVGYGDCKDTDVVLPSTYRGIPITGIIGPRSQAQSIDSNVADDAFAGQNITSVTFGNAITSIGAQAFLNTPLTRVEIPAGVTELKTGTFQECKQLTNVTFAENSQLATIGDNCFEGDISLLAGGALAFPESLVSIGAGAFSRCTSFSVITFPSTRFTTIGPAAFAYCSNLSQIYFSSTITTIGDYAFLGLPDGLTWGTSVARGSGAKTLANSPFNRETKNGNNGLWNLIAYDSVNRKSVYLSMTWNNGDIKGTDDFIYTQAGDGSINIIRYEPIPDHQSYTRVCVPQSIGAGTTVKTISADAFTNYRNTLTMIALPKTLTALPEKMFYDAAYNTHLTAIFVPDNDLNATNESEWEPFDGKLDLSKSTSLTDIGAQCFGGAEKSDLEWPKITSVSLPKTLRHIYNWGLRGFYNVNSLTFQDPYTCPTEGDYPLALPTTREEMLAQYLYCYRGSFQNMGKNATSTSQLRFPANIFFYDNNNGYHFSDCNFISDLIFQERNYYYDLEHSQSDKGEVFFQIPKNCFNSCRNIKSITTLNVDGTISDYSFPSRVFASDYAFAHVGISWNGTKPITSNKYPGLHRIYLGPDYYNGNFSSLAFAGVSGLTVYLDGVQSNSKKFNKDSSFDLSSTSYRERIDGTSVKMPLYQDVKLLKNGAVDDQHSYLLQYTHEGCTYDFVTDKTTTDGKWNVTLTRYYYDTTLDTPPTVAKVPSTFTKDGKTFQVTKIGDNAFYRSCRFVATTANAGLATVQLPDTIKEIGAYAFAFTETLTRITTDESTATNYNLPDSLTTIGAKAFFYTHLNKVKLNANLTTLATGENNYGNGLLGATNYAYTKDGNDIQNPINTIYDIGSNQHFYKADDGVIYEDKNKKVGGKKSYKAIGYDADGKGNNATVQIGINIGEDKICDEVAPRAFAQQTNIKTVVFAQTVTKIGNAAFQPLIRSNSSNRYENNVASNITTVSWETAPTTTVTLGEYSFANCTKMTSFGLPSTVTTIPNYCFYNAKLCEWDDHALQNITIIKQSAFKLAAVENTNKGPTYLDLSAATEVQVSAFENCSNVKTIDFGARTKSAAGIAGDSSGGVTMGESCFKNCLSKDGSTKSVFIPKQSLAKTGKPFDGCSELSKIYLCELEPRAGWSVTWNNNGTTNIDQRLYSVDGSRPEGTTQLLWWYGNQGGTTPLDID